MDSGIVDTNVTSFFHFPPILTHNVSIGALSITFVKYVVQSVTKRGKISLFLNYENLLNYQ